MKSFNVRQKLKVITKLMIGLVFVSANVNSIYGQSFLYDLQSTFVDYRFGVMLHFNMGTFTDEEWAMPKQDPKIFNPTDLNCDQWADAAVSAGMKYGILTTKHHDGFCLWDSKYTDYDVANSPYKKDIVKEYVDAFRKKGLAPCLYFSIWDRHHGVEEGGEDQEQFVLNQLTELLTNYGEIPMIIFDGWNWKMGHRLISYQRVSEHIKKLQPNCLISEHNGNSNFQTDIIYYEGPKGVFPPGNNVFASQMALTMTDGWFWHESSPKNVKGVDYALDKLQRLEPLYCNFMLNIAPNKKGLFDDKVVAKLKLIGEKWEPDMKRLPLPQQPENFTSYLEPIGISASKGEAHAQPDLPVNAGTPIAKLLAEPSPAVMIDGCSDEIPHNGGFSPFQTYWEFDDNNGGSVLLDFGEVKEMSKLYYLPTRWLGYEGLITKYKVLLSEDGESFTTIKEGQWQKNSNLKIASFSESKARYVKFEIMESIGRPTISEIGVGN